VAGASVGELAEACERFIGEAFVRAHPALAWAVGRNDTAPQGQPAVTGFRHAMEMPVLLVAENLIAGSVSGDHPEGHIATAVAQWVSSVP
jgi:hypothetical protein